MPAAAFTRRMLIACSVAFAIQMGLGLEASVARWAMYGPAVDDGEWWRLLTGGFLHGSLLHLAMNMLALWVLGNAIEPVYRLAGSWRFPVICMGSLLTGSLGAYFQHHDTPAVGASGAVFGLLAAAVILPRRMGLPWNELGVVPWIGVNLVVTFAVPGISIGGHVGGFVGGAILAWLVVPRRLRTPAADEGRLSDRAGRATRPR